MPRSSLWHDAVPTARVPCPDPGVGRDSLWKFGEPMIGQLVFAGRDREVVLTLTDSLCWEGGDTAELDRIREAFPLEPEPDLPNLLVGRHALFQAAERMGAEVTLPKLPRREPAGQL